MRILDKIRRQKHPGIPHVFLEHLKNPLISDNVVGLDGGEEVFTIWELLKSRIDKIPYINADNIADYYFVQNPKEFWDMGDLPSVAPPFEDFFIDYKAPKIINSEEYGTTKNDRNVELGAYVMSSRDPDTGKFEMVLFPFASFKNFDNVFGPYVAIYLELNKDGSIIGKDIELRPMFEIDKMTEEIADTIRSAADVSKPLLVALSFMNCKNVVLDKFTQPVKLQKKRIRNHGTSYLDYHVININPMKTILKYDGNIKEHGITKAMHICRGHFRTYDETSKLFGKIAGTFWIPSHVKGNVGQLRNPKYNIKL